MRRFFKVDKQKPIEDDNRFLLASYRSWKNYALETAILKNR